MLSVTILLYCTVDCRVCVSFCKREERRQQSWFLCVCVRVDGGVETEYEWMRMDKKVLAHNHLKPNAQGVFMIELRVRYFPESAEFCVADNATLVRPSARPRPARNNTRAHSAL